MAGKISVGMITCNYYMQIYGYQKPEGFSWGDMCDKWRREQSPAGFLALAQAIRDLGYDGIEIWEPTYSYTVFSLQSAADMRARLAEMGFVSIVYCIGGWSAPGGWSPATEGTVDAAYAFAKALGARVVTGCVADAGYLLPIIDAAGRKHGIKFAIENHPEPSLRTPQEVASAAAKYRTVGANIDAGIYHSMGFDVLEAYELLKAKVYHAHFKDTKREGAGSGGGAFAVGEGDTPLAELLDCLQRDAYDGMVSVEMNTLTDPTPGLARSLEYIRQRL